MVGHVAVRINVMGERGVRNEDATNADIDAMAAIVARGHRRRRARLLDVAGRQPQDRQRRPGARHLRPRGRAVRDRGRHVGRALRRVPARAVGRRRRRPGGGAQGARLDAAALRRVRPARCRSWCSRCRARPTCGASCSTARGTPRRDGAIVVPQVANRPFGMLLGLTNRHPFVMRPTFAELAGSEPDSLDELVAELVEARGPRARSSSEGDTVPTDDRFATIGLIAGHMPQLVFPLGDDADYEPTRRPVARGAGRGGRGQPARAVLRPHARARRAGDVPRALLQLLRR